MILLTEMLLSVELWGGPHFPPKPWMGAQHWPQKKPGVGGLAVLVEIFHYNTGLIGQVLSLGVTLSDLQDNNTHTADLKQCAILTCN